ncbi:MAG: AEC family transporter [Synergistaceae bacterium]|nr:AEC family transporter [Synergistaceae bacterium]
MHGFLVILPVALVVAAGWMLGRKGTVSSEAFAQINQALYWVVFPALIFRMTATADMSAFFDRNMVLAVYVSFLTAPPLAWLASKLSGDKPARSGASALMVIRSSTVFMGLPVITVAVGMRGVEVLSIYLAFTFIGCQVLSILWAQLSLSGGISGRPLLGTAFSLARNPLIVSSIGGFSLALLGFSGFPLWLDETLKLLGNVGSGMALLSLGASIKFRGLPQMLARAWRDTAFKLLFYPALLWMLLTLWPVSPVVFQTVILIAAMPASVDCFILSHVLGMDSGHAAATITATTILSGLTVPLWISLLAAFS